MAKQRYFKVLHKAGAYLDDNHYSQDEVVPYNPTPEEDKQGKPLWGQEVDAHGNEIGAEKDPEFIREVQTTKLVEVNNGGNGGKPAEDGLTDEQKEQLDQALKLLEAGNDGHWTKQGKPRVDALTAILGFAVTVKDVEVFAPDFRRPAKTA